MERIVFETVGPSGRKQRQGWLVPGTEELLVVDQRFPLPESEEVVALDAYDFFITHRPTGFRVVQEPYTDASTLLRAAAIARAFFAECKSLGVDLHQSDPNKIIAPVQALPREDRLRFWERIQATQEFLEPAETV